LGEGLGSLCEVPTAKRKAGDGRGIDERFLGKTNKNNQPKRKRGGGDNFSETAARIEGNKRVGTHYTR